MTLLNKGRSLQGVTGQFHAMRQALTTPEHLAQFDKWKDLRSQIANLTWHPPQDPQYLQQLIGQAAALEETLARDAQGFRDLRLSPPDQVIPQIAARLPKDAVLIEYVAYRPYRFAARGTEPRWEDRRYLALLLHNDQQIDLVNLGPAAAIEQAVDRLRDSLTVVKDAATEGQALYQLVLAPLLPHLHGRTHLLLSPAGPLDLVSFGALHDGRGYLVDRFSFTYLTTGRSLLPPPPQGTPSRTAVIPDLLT